MPKAIGLIPQSSNPVTTPGYNGIWSDLSNNLMYTPISGSPVNVSTGASGANSQAQIKNNTGSTITAFSPVSINGSGELQLVDVTNVNNSIAFIGLAAADILNGAKGAIIISGIAFNLSTPLPFGAGVWVAHDGTLTSTQPQIGVGSFASGNAVLRVGVIVQDPDNVGQRNIVLNCQFVGTL